MGPKGAIHKRSINQSQTHHRCTMGHRAHMRQHVHHDQHNSNSRLQQYTQIAKHTKPIGAGLANLVLRSGLARELQPHILSFVQQQTMGLHHPTNPTPAHVGLDHPSVRPLHTQTSRLYNTPHKTRSDKNQAVMVPRARAAPQEACTHSSSCLPGAHMLNTQTSRPQPLPCPSPGVHVQGLHLPHAPQHTVKG